MSKKKADSTLVDVSKQYIIDLCVQGESSLTVPTVCNVAVKGNMIIATAVESPELFETHRYIDEFFQWLLYTGKIKVYNKDSENNNEP